VSNDLDYIAQNIKEIKQRVSDAAQRSNRKQEDINIIAVTKTVSPERIEKAIDEGLNKLGENRVQELCEKYDIINRDCKWDIIGHLQTNKVKYIIDKVNMIHSVDSLDLIEELQKKSEKVGRVLDILLQVNVAEEKSKFGLHLDEVTEYVNRARKYDALRVKGLMTIAPFVQNPEEIRGVFRQLYKKFIDIREKNNDNIDMKYLSMGMSNDFEVAIEEGANIVRIGTAIFGRR